jgi:HAD superfamily hydrolase (TIGR01509 family)
MPAIRAILFDFDGTLTRPEALDFGHLRAVTGCPPGLPILEYLATLTDPVAHAQARQRLDEAELAAARHSHPNPGAVELLAWCRRRGLALGILTRNTRAAVDLALANFPAGTADHFAIIVARDHDLPPKPDPAGVHHACEVLRVAPRELLVVGDFRFDIEAGQRAGAWTAYLTNGDAAPPLAVPPDFVIHRLAELPELPLFAGGD